jgi:hypothetical protein
VTAAAIRVNFPTFPHLSTCIDNKGEEVRFSEGGRDNARERYPTYAAVSSAIKSESRSIPALAPGSASVDRWIDDEWISSRGQTSSHNHTIIYHNGHPHNLRVGHSSNASSRDSQKVLVCDHLLPGYVRIMGYIARSETQGDQCYYPVAWSQTKLSVGSERQHPGNAPTEGRLLEAFTDRPTTMNAPRGERISQICLLGSGLMRNAAYKRRPGRLADDVDGACH